MIIPDCSLNEWAASIESHWFSACVDKTALMLILPGCVFMRVYVFVCVFERDTSMACVKRTQLVCGHRVIHVCVLRVGYFSVSVVNACCYCACLNIFHKIHYYTDYFTYVKIIIFDMLEIRLFFHQFKVRVSTELSWSCIQKNNTLKNKLLEMLLSRHQSLCDTFLWADTAFLPVLLFMFIQGTDLTTCWKVMTEYFLRLARFYCNIFDLV